LSLDLGVLGLCNVYRLRVCCSMYIHIHTKIARCVHAVGTS
jgi:hypothetical protein